MRNPQVTPVRGLPERVTVYEVGARDGLQNESVVLDVATKIEFIQRLIASGLSAVELTSFVPPSWIPQLADAEALLAGLGALPGRHPVLVPNQRGLDRAIASGVREIAVFASATESFAQRNLNRSRAESLEVFSTVVARGIDEGLAVRGYVSMCFGDPWEGAVEPGPVADVVEALVAMGCSEVSLGDTIGVATPGQVIGLLDELASRAIGPERLAVHFHDTYGQALANTFVALQYGVTTVDASAGGLGGCPYAGSATGNLATEDLVWHLHGMGVETGVDLEALCRTSLWMADRLGRPSPSRTVTALASSIEANSLDGAAIERREEERYG